MGIRKSSWIIGLIFVSSIVLIPLALGELWAANQRQVEAHGYGAARDQATDTAYWLLSDLEKDARARPSDETLRQVLTWTDNRRHGSFVVIDDDHALFR